MQEIIILLKAILKAITDNKSSSENIATKSDIETLKQSIQEVKTKVDEVFIKIDNINQPN